MPRLMGLGKNVYDFMLEQMELVGDLLREIND